MSRLPQLYPWSKEITTRLPGLGRALARVLALWSLGMLLARRCGLDSVTSHVASLLKQPFNTVRQRLREFYQEASAKRGRGRKDFQVDACFAHLLRWVTSFWSQKRLALALDVTNLGSRFHVLCVSALCGGIGIPVAWKILIGNQPDAWHPYWCQLLSKLKDAVGEDWQVVVLSDRGLESPRLFQEIVDLGWHPLMRIKRAAKFRPQGWRDWYWLDKLVAKPGQRFAMAGRAYKGQSLSCTLLACWDEGHSEPWFLLTDLPTCAANPCWYAWRAWIEQGFKMVKSQGLNWQQTRMTKLPRAERHFLAVAVTTLWLVSVGTEQEEETVRATLGRLTKSVKQKPQGMLARKRCRRIRLFVQGAAAIIAALLVQAPLPQGKLIQEQWPEPWHTRDLTEIEFLNQPDLQL